MANYWDNVVSNIFLIRSLLVIMFVIVSWKVISFSLFRKSNIPGPKGNPILGHLLQLKNSKDVVLTLEKWKKTYGPIVEYRPLGIFAPRCFLVTDAESMKQILVTNCFKYQRPVKTRQQFLPFTHKSLFLSNGKDHSRQRKMINPVFKINNMKGMVDVMQKKAMSLVKVWTDSIISDGNEVKESSFFVHNDLTFLTLDVIGECAFSYQFNAVTERESKVSSAFLNLLQGLNFKSNVFESVPILRMIPTERKKREYNDCKITIDIIMEIVRQKREEQKRQKIDYVKHKDLLDLLMETFDEEDGLRMDEEELYAQVFVFMIAGHETSSVAISWTLYFLAQYPEIQEKVRREIKEILKDGDLTWDTFESMEYLPAVINESLRLRPPIALYRRDIIEDDNILGYKIPQGSVIVLSPYILHRDPKYWKDPEEFNPDRFLTAAKDENPINRFAFQPFSSGPRTCIGYKFALMEIKVVLSVLLQHFAFSMVPGMSFECELSLSYKPKPSLQLLVRNL